MSVNKYLVLIVVLATCCHGRSTDSAEDSVVSVYTTQSTTAGTNAPLDVYRQIADNIAEKITSPIYRFLGIGRNNTSDGKLTTKKSWDKIELLDDAPEDVSKIDLKPVDNDITKERDVEELSVEALKKSDKKPEKITLYSNYLPTNEKFEFNDTISNDVENDDDDNDDGDDEPLELDEEKPREGFVYFLELIGSFIQLAYGALLAIFKPSNSSTNNSS